MSEQRTRVLATPITKCTATSYCKTLSDRITESSFSKRPGFAVGQVFAAGIDEMPTPTIVAYPVWFNAPKSADLPTDERRLILNFCPWCGVSMAGQIKRFQRSLAKARKSRVRR